MADQHITASRRQALGALVASAALGAPVAYANATTNSVSSGSTAWDAALRRFLTVRSEEDYFNRTVHDPACDQLDRLDRQSQDYRDMCARLNWDAIADRSDQMSDATIEAEADLLATPAPDMKAVVWKMDHLFGEDACGIMDATPSYRKEFTQSILDDLRRLGGIN